MRRSVADEADGKTRGAGRPRPGPPAAHSEIGDGQSKRRQGAAIDRKNRSMVFLLPKSEVFAIVFRWIDTARVQEKGELQGRLAGCEAREIFCLNRP
jgi:hypothetical protein